MKKVYELSNIRALKVPILKSNSITELCDFLENNVCDKCINSIIVSDDIQRYFMSLLSTKCGSDFVFHIYEEKDKNV